MLEGFEREASTFAADVDRAFWITTGISAVVFVLIVGLMAFFIFRYHHSRVEPGAIRNIKDHIPLEIAWTVIPTILFYVIFYYGYSAFRELRTMPEDAFEVEVLGKRWSWTFIYPNGKRTTELYVPMNENIRLRLHAPGDDVLHSFYVPAFRVKEDVVPGRENHLWFKATVPGRYDVQCAEYCGTRHSYMLSKVEVMEKAAFDEWYAGDKLSPHDTTAPTGEGEVLYKTLGCASCHSLDGSVIVGPSFQGLFGKKTWVLTGGKRRQVTVDDAYIRDSVRTPAKDVAEGFPEGIMPNLSDQINKEQMEAIIAFIKQQRAPGKEAAVEPAEEPAPQPEVKPQTQGTPEPETEASAGPPDGAALFKTKGCTACHSLDGSKRIGPSLKGIYGRKVTVVTDGKAREVVADEAYLKRSVETPNADVVEGFPPGLMPQFGKMLSPDEVEALVTYLKGVK
jgi:cytochrome c oxidase subunit 2